MVSEKILKELSGFSGCKILLIEKEGVHIVRKISKSPDYNIRMIEQKDKQEYFYHHLQTQLIRTPKILDSGYLNGLFYFDMEYINGISMVKFIEKANLEELISISKKIIELIKLFANSKKEEIIFLNQKILKKLNEINDKEKDSSELINEIKKLIKDENEEIISTFCHGDLTLENIIYDEENKVYYLIDFLDSFIDHYWQDVSKLFQDLEGHWYSFRDKEINTNTMEIKTAIITDTIIKDFLDKDKYLEKHPLLLSTTFCRILPYAKREEKPWIKEKIKMAIDSKPKSILFK